MCVYINMQFGCFKASFGQLSRRKPNSADDKYYILFCDFWPKDRQELRNEVKYLIPAKHPVGF